MRIVLSTFGIIVSQEILPVDTKVVPVEVSKEKAHELLANGAMRAVWAVRVGKRDLVARIRSTVIVISTAAIV